MYLNVNATQGALVPASSDPSACHSCGEDGACTTPEIITSLITMATTQLSSNGGGFTTDDNSSSGSPPDSAAYCVMTPHDPHHPPSDGHHQAQYCNGSSAAMAHGLLQHRTMGQMSPPGASLSSPSFDRSSSCSSPMCSSPPSIQATRTHLIKESLKVTIQSKRYANGQFLPALDSRLSGYRDELTPEDEERRRRRRERNKVAATKCRNKKKERTLHLMLESESLEQTNHTLRCEIERLERERENLLNMLAYHMPACPMQPANQGHHFSSMNMMNMNNSCAVGGF